MAREDVARWVPTASLLHSNGDAMDVAVKDGRGPASIAFYTTGQLFLEEYWTLATIARAGIGTNHPSPTSRRRPSCWAPGHAEEPERDDAGQAARP